MFVPTLSNVGGSHELSSKCILLGVKGFLSKKTWRVHHQNPQGFLKTDKDVQATGVWENNIRSLCV